MKQRELLTGSPGKHETSSRPRRLPGRQYKKGTAVLSSRRCISLVGCLPRPWGSPPACPACQSWACRVLLHLGFVHTAIISQLCHIRETYCEKAVSNYIRTNLGVQFYILLCLIRGTFYFLTEHKDRNQDHKTLGNEYNFRPRESDSENILFLCSFFV